MRKIKTLIHLIALVATLCAGVAGPAVAFAVITLTDTELEDVTGQALFTMDKIQGCPSSGGCSSSSNTQMNSNLTFYRITLDSQLGFNINANQLQLGCGGVNQGIMTGCDIDFQNVSFMGAGTSNNPANNGDFVLTRPYLELAIQNDGAPGSRELAGVNIGAETADGTISVGSFNPSGGGGCTPSSSAFPGNNQCHNGINALSGYMTATITAGSQLTGGCVTFFGVCVAPYTATMPQQSITMHGTRITAPVLPATATATAYGINITLEGMLQDPLNYIHQLQIQSTSNFMLSFQRQQIAWPNFNGASYAYPSNTGWWLNLPNNVVIPQFNSPTAPYISTTQAIGGAFGEAVGLTNIDIGSRPIQNCYGKAIFC